MGQLRRAAPSSTAMTVPAAAEGRPLQQIRVCQSTHMSFFPNIWSSPSPAAAPANADCLRDLGTHDVLNDCTMTVDGTDFRIPQKGAATKGNAFASHKYAGKSALRYELGVDILAGNLVWIQGPYPAGKYSDIVIFNEALTLSWKCRFFRCRPQLILTTWCRVFPTRRPDTAVVSATSCDVGFFFSVSYVVSLPNCRHVVVVTTTTYHTHLVFLICFTPHPRLNTTITIVLPTSLPPLLLPSNLKHNIFFFHSGSKDDSPRNWCMCLGNVIKY